MRGVRVAWSADLGGLPVDPAVRETLAPARQVLTDLGCEVIDAAPDLTGADEGFRTWRALKYATAFGPLLAERPGDVGPNVAWNVQRGLELSAADLSRATRLLAALAERISAFFETFDVLACPVSQVPPFDIDLDWVHEIDGVPQHTYLDWMRSAYLISATGTPGDLGSRRDSLPSARRCRVAAGWPAAGRPPPRRLGTAVYRVRLRAGDGLRHDPAARA